MLHIKIDGARDGNTAAQAGKSKSAHLQALAHTRAQLARHSQVCNLEQPSRGEQQVGGLDVAVHNRVAAGQREGASCLK